MGRYLLSGLLLLAFSALNAFAAENPEKTAVGLGEVCDKRIGPLCKFGPKGSVTGGVTQKLTTQQVTLPPNPLGA